MTNQKLRDALTRINRIAKFKHSREVIFYITEKALSEPDWQPIETAPRDGSVIELWNVIWCCVIPVYFRNEENGLIWREVTSDSGWRNAAFSHWRPKSQPPTQDK